jgi:drug efflux transport system permease protein
MKFISWERVLEIVRKEYIIAFRDPRMRGLLIGPPILQMLLFGYAVNLDVEHAKVAWIDHDRTVESRELLSSLRGSPSFDVLEYEGTSRDARELLDHGSVAAVIEVLPNFARDVKRGLSAPVQILVDGTNSNTASIVSAYAAQVVQVYAVSVLAQQRRSGAIVRAGLPPESQPPPAARLADQTRVWFNPNLQSRIFFVPGIIVNIIAIVTIQLTAMSIVRERELGTMEQLSVTPLRPAELILGKLLPFAAMGLFEVFIVTSLAWVVFRIPLRGSILVLVASSVLFLLTTLGVGLFMSTVSHTQQQAMMAGFFFFMPALLLSGFNFPIRNMPVIVQYIDYLNPLRYFMKIVRGVFLKGTGPATLWPELLALAVIGITIFTLSVLRFHKSLD